jgi:AmmeMemoRadiSam system protein A
MFLGAIVVFRDAAEKENMKRVQAWAIVYILIALCGCTRANDASNPPAALAGATNAASVVSVQQEGGSMKIKEMASGQWNPGLTDDEKVTLFAIADDTLAWCVRGSPKPFPFDKYTITDKLKVKMATFVTLKIGENLRGCIGSLAPVEQLYRSVHDNAVNAAMNDYRFRAVAPEELPRINVHISILSPITGIPSLDDFKIGAHGIIVEKGMNRAVYLPEVAVEQKWTKEETLSELSLKAGLDAGAWKQGAKFKVFSSVVLAKEE